MSKAVELSKHVQEGLVLFDDSSLFPDDETFAKFLTAVMKEASQTSASGSLPTNAPIPFKQCFSAALSLSLEAARQNADAKTEVMQILDDLTISTERSQSFVAAFNEHKQSIRAVLSKTGTAFDTVMGITWRIDYYIKSDSLEIARMPVYFITLKCRGESGEPKDLQFTCNLQELQDLSAKLKDARNAVQPFLK